MGYLTSDPQRRWPNTGIPYEIDDTTVPAESYYRQVVETAIKAWNSKSPLQLVPRAGQADFAIYKRSAPGGGCKSAVGRIGGPQDILCDLDWNEAPAALLHETAHAAGFLHEHQRPDRYLFVDAHPPAGPNPHYDHNVAIIGDGLPVGTYDCGSLMHYGMQDAFLSFKPGGCQAVGSSTLSSTDITALQVLIGAKYQILWKGLWANSWTHVVPYSTYPLSEQHFLAYSASTGQVHFDRLGRDGQGFSILGQANWEPGLSHIGHLSVGLQQYLLKYSQQAGSVQIGRVRLSGEAADTVWQGSWAKGWSQVVPLGIGGPETDHLLVYNTVTGSVRIDRINSGGVGTTNVWKGTWGKGWTNIMPFRVGYSDWRILVYNADSGLVHFDALTVPSAGPQHLFKQSWGKGWTHFVPYPTLFADVEDPARFIAYNRNTGEAHFDSVSSSNEWEISAMTTWAKGWSTLAPVFLRPLPHRGNRGLLAYRGQTGEVHFDRLL